MSMRLQLIQLCKLCRVDVSKHGRDCPYHLNNKLMIAELLAQAGFNVTVKYGDIYIAGERIDPVNALKALKVLGGNHG
jgi:hypothetical protein